MQECFKNVSSFTMFSIGLDNFSILIFSYYVLQSQYIEMAKLDQITDYKMADAEHDRGL